MTDRPLAVPEWDDLTIYVLVRHFGLRIETVRVRDDLL